MKKKGYCIIILILLSILLFSGCTSKEYHEIMGKIDRVRICGAFGHLIEVTFDGNESFGIMEFQKESGDIDWFEKLKPFEGKNVTIYYVVSQWGSVVGIYKIEVL